METTRVRSGMNLGTGERVLSAVAGSALVTYGLAQRSMRGVAVALLGGAWVGRGITGRSRLYQLFGVRGLGSVEVQQSIIVQRPRHEVYAFWRNIRNYPRFMHRVEAVEPLPDGRLRFHAKGMFGRPIEWVSVTRAEREDELVTWASEDGPFQLSGEARFGDAAGGRGTERKVAVRYQAPGGRGALALASLLGDEPGQVLAAELRRFRQLMETGEIATVAGQPEGPRTVAGKALTRRLGEEAR
ncbi:MAG: SRPBCC family protein [Myxococcaceae bacterium]